MPPMPRHLVSVSRAAALLGLRRAAVWKAARRGEIEWVRLSPGRIGYDRDSVLLYAERTRGARHREMPRDIRCWGPRNRPVEHTELMTTEEAAAVLGVVRNTVQGLVARGVLPAYQADPCKRGCPLKLPAFYVYRLAERPAYRARRAAFARSAPAGRAQTSGWADKDIQSVPKSGPTRSCDRDYGEFYTTRQAAVVLGVSPRTVYGLHRKGRLEGGSRTPELDAYLNALGAPRRSAGNRWLFFRKQDVHRLKNDPSYQKRRAADALGRDPEHVAAREAEQLARWFDARARARRSPPLFAPWPKLI